MNETKYDSRADTLAHILRVNQFLLACCVNLQMRAEVHDQSKLQEPEKSVFDACTIKLKAIPYGSDQYKAALAELKPALDHHYASNSHHPEHFTAGVNGMSLFDIIEMLMDWKAATERMVGGGDIMKSIEINTARFGLSPQMAEVFRNTVYEMNWVARPIPTMTTD